MSQSETKTMPEAVSPIWSRCDGGVEHDFSNEQSAYCVNGCGTTEESFIIKTLKAECERLQTDIDKHLGLFEESIRHSFKEREDKLKSENAALVVENEKLKEELDAYRFYADDATKELVWIEIDKKEAP